MTAEIKKIDWCDDAETALRRIPLQRGYSLEYFQRCVEDGEKDLFAVLINGEVQGYVVAWIDGMDLVLGMAAQSAPGAYRAAIFLRLFEALARKIGCEYVRGHTIRKGMIEVAVSEGYGVEEIVYRKPVGGAHGEG